MSDKLGVYIQNVETIRHGVSVARRARVALKRRQLGGEAVGSPHALTVMAVEQPGEARGEADDDGCHRARLRAQCRPAFV